MKKTVFISSTHRDLAEHRRVVWQVLEGFDVAVRGMERFGARQLIEAHRKLVLPMEMPVLRSVIEKPAALPDVQLTFEGDLVSDLLFEVQGQVGALPLLQFTLDQLYQRRRDHLLTLQAYQEIGGVKGAFTIAVPSLSSTLSSRAIELIPPLAVPMAVASTMRVHSLSKTAP